MSGGPVIFVDDDPDLRRATTQVLALAGFEVRAFDGAEAALAALGADFEGPVVTDIRMPRMNGLQLFERIRALDPELPVLLVTGHGDIELAVVALKDGAYDFISKPFDGERLTTAVAHAAEKRRLVLEDRRLRADPASRGGFREDLYYRLNVVTLRIPALRERRGDVALLFAHFLKRSADRFGRPAPEITAAIHDHLSGHDWPGNVRELRSCWRIVHTTAMDCGRL